MLEQDEEECSNNRFPLISSPYSDCWQIQQGLEHGMICFDCSSRPASPLKELTLWTHHQESGMIKGAAKAQTQAFDSQLQEDDVDRGALSMNDWRCEIRQRVADKLVIRRFVSSSGYMVSATSKKEYFPKTTGDMLQKFTVDMLQKFILGIPFTCWNKTGGLFVDECSKDQCMQLDAKSTEEESTLHNRQSGEDCAVLDPVQQRSFTEHGNLKRKGDTGPSGQDHTIFELGNQQKMDKKLKKTWGIGGSISLEDLKRHFGMKREEAAESLEVSISTFKRICREHGIKRWPSKKIKRDRRLLSNLSSNETVPVAGGTQIPISTNPTAFASIKVLVKSNQKKSWSSNLSLDNEIGTSIHHDVLRNDEGTDGENIMIQEGDSAVQEILYKPQEFEPARNSPIPAYSLPDAPTLLSPLPQERMPAKDPPGQQGEEIARQIDMADGTSHLEKQDLGRERVSCNTENEIIVCVEDSSSYDFRNVSESIQDHLTDYASLHQLNEDQLISVDDTETTRIVAHSMLASKSEPSVQNDARTMKLIFEKLITLPLEDLTNPNHEASMKEALTILAGNLSLFTDEQAKQLLEFKFDFPTIMYSWRDCSQSRIGCENFFADFEKTKSLLETSAKDEEDLKDKYTQQESKEKELMAQLEAVRKEKNGIAEQRCENFNQTKHLGSLLEEQAGRTKEKEMQMTIASAKLDKLKNQWVSVQSSFT